ncbi:BBE domain-containing protein [Amycolatopsis vastitatis]|nr:BBE domain-containing protein [Amycolatopsis vastitatis]
MLTDGSPGYDVARAVWNGEIDRHPALARIKAAYDPRNVFHHNANIPPAP